MRFEAEVLVTLKPGLADPQGKAVEGALPALGWTNVSGVRVGKHVHLEVEGPSEDAVREQIEAMAERFLSNPVIEDARIVEVRPGGPRGRGASAGRRERSPQEEM